ncbi:hypothetical protein E6P09_01945 [Haloferax mediterranei ATCC 33500]|uniref:Uncharacterized protein n=1 Tax=Haloferax mediterranei (strain ATCC 33500 / DSM 1411 / JCM 8866 / NBRC 14739 / NCIMB 2177 / R-4) TaxID=523841 RepID=I3R5Y6_HALMT|nr:hypothetical protein [Haloferax mediterranei]AFK19646.1 hypothetical protein HFX_1950 [Haloferax mediterranei ATCC 33500]AHZ23034.1 hypothetical protein BM92_10470 [Haloferax mediterranei ATCC 33500]ELZ99964.1 hypothetical protein C439_11533 [Haloferax mediterranei ATCC 33500]MDX5987614.1 hypothetical protein [Haloferax mediterranei ATCC 33500]QCQ74101.1 hypothetical protein E6P09_01945 [Haloferax mediterranei ATCC 33500]
MFESSRYEVRQKVSIGTKYVVYENDTPILSAKKKKFKLKEDFRLNDYDSGDERFRVKADSVLDVSAAYDIVDSQTGERVGAVKRGAFSFAKHTYQLLGPDGSVVGRIVEDNVPMAIARRVLTTLIPFSYRIENATGKPVGSIDEAFSFRDKYTIDIDTEQIDPRLLVVGAVVIDAIEEN